MREKIKLLLKNSKSLNLLEKHITFLNMVIFTKNFKDIS